MPSVPARRASGLLSRVLHAPTARRDDPSTSSSSACHAPRPNVGYQPASWPCVVAHKFNVHRRWRVGRRCEYAGRWRWHDREPYQRERAVRCLVAYGPRATVRCRMWTSLLGRQVLTHLLTNVVIPFAPLGRARAIQGHPEHLHM